MQYPTEPQLVSDTSGRVTDQVTRVPSGHDGLVACLA